MQAPSWCATHRLRFPKYKANIRLLTTKYDDTARLDGKNFTFWLANNIRKVRESQIHRHFLIKLTGSAIEKETGTSLSVGDVYETVTQALLFSTYCLPAVLSVQRPSSNSDERFI